MRRIITGYPKAARVRGVDRNHPGEWMLGLVLRPSGEGFLCSVPDISYKGNAQLQDVRPATDIEILDMPLTEDDDDEG